MQNASKKQRGLFWQWKELCIVFLMFLILASSCAGSSTQPTATRTRLADIFWDTWGVPHIFSASDESLFYAFGRAQMQNHADLLLTLYGQARGRAAEYWGSQYTSSDIFVRTMGFPARANQWYQAQTPAFRRDIDAFVAGMNDYAAQHSDQITADLKVVLPLKATDVFAHVQRVLAEFLSSGCGVEVDMGGSKGAGSNGWAIGPGHSSSGDAMLLANPHLAWSGEFTFIEAQLTSPSISAYGVALVGFPVLNIAFNQYLSWTHTVNTIDACDAYRLTLSGNGYLFDGKVRAFDTQTQTLLVKQSDGTLKRQPLVIKRSVQGPVFQVTNSLNQRRSIALRFTGVDQFPAYGVLQEWWDMARASNLSQFQQVLQRLQIPMFTVIYADRDGHVMSLFNGEVPKRPSGDADYWSSVVPGDTSSTLWTSILDYQSLPKVIDPPSDWVQNSNSPPWYTTFPQQLFPQQYPAYLAPVGDMSLREQSGVDMLTAQKTISFDQMITDKFSSRLEIADRLLPDLIAAARASNSDLAHQAADVLQRWDRTDDANSKGAALFFQWAVIVITSQKSPFAVPWDPAHPRTTPAGLADPQALVTDLEQAVKIFNRNNLPLDLTWGAVFRLKRGNVDVPASGGYDLLGSFRALSYTYQPGASPPFYAVSGDSYIAAVDFSSPMRAKVLLTYGNASQPDSPHNGDQLTLYAKNQMRDAWLTLPEIEAHLEAHDEL